MIRYVFIFVLSCASFIVCSSIYAFDLRIERNNQFGDTLASTLTYRISEDNKGDTNVGGGVIFSNQEDTKKHSEGFFVSFNRTGATRDSLAMDTTVNLGAMRYRDEGILTHQDTIFTDIKIGIHHQIAIEKNSVSLFAKTGAGLSSVFPLNRKEGFSKLKPKLEEVYPYLAFGLSL